MAKRKRKVNVGSLTLSEDIAVEFQKLRFCRSALVEALLKLLFSNVSAETLLLELTKSSSDKVVKKFLCSSDNSVRSENSNSSAKPDPDFYEMYGSFLDI